MLGTGLPVRGAASGGGIGIRGGEWTSRSLDRLRSKIVEDRES